jgi:hypothetical protein
MGTWSPARPRGPRSLLPRVPMTDSGWSAASRQVMPAPRSAPCRGSHRGDCAVEALVSTGRGPRVHDRDAGARLKSGRRDRPTRGSPGKTRRRGIASRRQRHPCRYPVTDVCSAHGSRRGQWLNRAVGFHPRSPSMTFDPPGQAADFPVPAVSIPLRGNVGEKVSTCQGARDEDPLSDDAPLC